MKTVVIIRQAGMGLGSDELGQKILATFLGKCSALAGLCAILFYNGGVQLLAEGSTLLPVLSALQERGIDLLACGSCVDYFNLRDHLRVGQVKGMDDLLVEMNRADKVITL
ncbi:MAG: hypothetical protein HJJLKODD_00932 [Phycisphaerae bacterium]|nr:hypothetical protein [Phycisphaerae bacterium]